MVNKILVAQCFPLCLSSFFFSLSFSFLFLTLSSVFTFFFPVWKFFFFYFRLCLGEGVRWQKVKARCQIKFLLTVFILVILHDG